MDKKHLFGAFIVAIALFFFWPAVVGKWQQVSALRETVAERQDLLKRRQEIFTNLAKQYQEYTAKLTQADGQKFAALVPVRKDQAEILSAMQDIAKDSGVTLNEMRISEGTGAPSTQFKTLSISLDMGGNYRSLRSFLSDLESYVRLLNVNTIQVSEDTRAAGQLKFAIKADAYFLK
jgi:Tfp pilus assembly protein PilO